MKFTIAAILIFISTCSQAQYAPVNGIVLIQNKPFNFTYSNTENLLQLQVIQNAMELKLNTEGHGLSTYAQLIFNNPSGRTFFADRMSMRLAFKSSNTAQIGMTDVTLSDSPSLLFVQPRSTASGLQNHSFVYDLLLKPLVNFTQPDTYPFTLLITVTPE